MQKNEIYSSRNYKVFVTNMTIRGISSDDERSSRLRSMTVMTPLDDRNDSNR